MIEVNFYIIEIEVMYDDGHIQLTQAELHLRYMVEADGTMEKNFIQIS